MEVRHSVSRCRRVRHSYELRIKPDGPVAVGDTIRILAVSPLAYHAPPKPLHEYDTYNPHIVGTIVDLRRTERGMGRMIILNQCRGSMVGEVEVSFPFLPEILGRTAGKRERMELATEGVETILVPLACVRPARIDVVTRCAGRDCSLTRPAGA